MLIHSDRCVVATKRHWDANPQQGSHMTKISDVLLARLKMKKGFLSVDDGVEARSSIKEISSEIGNGGQLSLLCS